MFCINVVLTVKDPKDVPFVREVLAQVVRGARKEKGVLRFDIYQSEAEPHRFLLNQHWASKEDWDAHIQHQTFREVYEPQVLPLVTRDPHICIRLR
jgi:quinol monooxygenase YgiN